MLAEEPPFRNLFGYATLYAEDGREMHKSWGNSIEFNEAAEEMGADTMRWLYASSKPEQNMLFGFGRGDETRRRFLIPLWNVYSFFVTYAQLDGWEPDKDGTVTQSPVAANAQMDRWIIERLDETTLAVHTAMANFDAERATQQLELLLDDLSNWYVRRSRRRFWKSEADTDKSAAYATLYHVLVEYTKLLAPFVPFVTEDMYQNLVRTVDADAPQSVHHQLYPMADQSTLDRRLLDKMRLAITTAALGRSARGAADVKLRQPLAAAKVFVGSQQERTDLMELADVLSEEINVKAIEIVSEVGQLVSYKLLPNNRVLGPKLGQQFPAVRQALSELDAAVAAATLHAGDTLEVSVNGDVYTLDSEDVLVQTESLGGLAVASEKGVTVAVDVALTPELVQEGYARDLVRMINNMRKDAGLDISDRITLGYEAESDVSAALSNFRDFIMQETLATKLAAGLLPEPLFAQTAEIGDESVTVSLVKS